MCAEPSENILALFTWWKMYALDSMDEMCLYVAQQYVFKWKKKDSSDTTKMKMEKKIKHSQNVRFGFFLHNSAIFALWHLSTYLLYPFIFIDETNDFSVILCTHKKELNRVFWLTNLFIRDTISQWIGRFAHVSITINHINSTGMWQ